MCVGLTCRSPGRSLPQPPAPSSTRWVGTGGCSAESSCYGDLRLRPWSRWLPEETTAGQRREPVRESSSGVSVHLACHVFPSPRTETAQWFLDVWQQPLVKSHSSAEINSPLKAFRWGYDVFDFTWRASRHWLQQLQTSTPVSSDPSINKWIQNAPQVNPVVVYRTFAGLWSNTTCRREPTNLALLKWSFLTCFHVKWGSGPQGLKIAPYYFKTTQTSFRNGTLLLLVVLTDSGCRKVFCALTVIKHLNSLQEVM